MAAKRTPDKDLFQDTTMTFGEHLDELRVCLIRAILGVALAFALALPPLDLASKTVNMIKEPLEDALNEYYVEQAEGYVQKQMKELHKEGLPVPGYEEVQDVILFDRLVPSVYYLNERDVLSKLAARYPEQLGKVELPLLAPANLANPREFARAVEAQREEEGPNPGKRIWELLPKDAQQLIARAASPRSPGHEFTAKDRRLLAAALNSVINDPKFFRPADFKAIDEHETSLVSVTEASQYANKQGTKYDLLMKSDLKPGSPEFNLMALNAAFPDSIETLRRDTMSPLILWRSVHDDPRTSIKSLNAHEMFMVYVKAAIIVGLVIASPWVFLQIWNFVAAGLYPHERRYVYVFLPISIVLFLSGVFLAFFFVFQPVLQFLLMFNRWMEVDPDIRISEWFGFALMLPVGFGIAFQLPMAMLFMERIGVFQVSDYLAKWRIAVLVIFFASMMLTPADPYSMLLMAVPLTILYFGGVVLCRYLPRGRNPFDAVDEPE